MLRYFLIIKGNEFDAMESAEKHGLSLAIGSHNHHGETLGFADTADWQKIYDWFNESARDLAGQFVVGTLLFFNSKESAS